MVCRNDGQKPWNFRRKMVVYTLSFCGSIVVLSILKDGISESVAETAITSAFSLAGAVIGSYTFGAVWQDTRKGDQ